MTAFARVLRVLAVAVGAVLAAELGFRLLAGPLGLDQERLRRFRDFVADGGQYAARPHVLYVRAPSGADVNSLGFLDREFPRRKTPGALRIACLGSSTTEGGNAAGRAGSYPYFLTSALEGRGGPHVETLNFGMSGWTTAETLVNYFLVVQDFEPDVVLIHEAANDVEPRAWPGFREDYSHYRRPWQGIRFSRLYRFLAARSDVFAAWQMQRTGSFDIAAVVNQPPAGGYRFEGGRLPPETAAPFRRNIRTILEHVRVRGGRPVLVTLPYDPVRAQDAPVFHFGIDEHNGILRELAREADVTLVDLDAMARRQPEIWRAQFLDLVHVTPEGNRLKAEAIADALLVPAAP